MAGNDDNKPENSETGIDGSANIENNENIREGDCL